MTYHAPLYIVRQNLVFGFHLLRTVLAEYALSRVVGLADRFGRVVFRYGHQFDARRQSSADGRYFISDRHCKICFDSVKLRIFSLTHSCDA